MEPSVMARGSAIVLAAALVLALLVWLRHDGSARESAMREADSQERALAPAADLVAGSEPALSSREDDASGRTAVEAEQTPLDDDGADASFGPTWRLHGRVIDSDGVPVARAEIRLLALGDASGAFANFSFRSDAEGRFSLGLGDEFEPLRSVRIEGRGLAALRDVGPPTDEGWDLGDVVLAPMPVLVRGRLVDREHRPVAGARVSAFQVTESALEPHWQVETSADGAFELHGGALGARLTLVASATGFVEWRVDVPVGADLGTCVLRRSPLLVGRLLLDAAVPAEQLALAVARLGPATPAFDGAEQASGYGPVALNADGSFQLAALAHVELGDLALAGDAWAGGPRVLWRAVPLAAASRGESTELGELDLRADVVVTRVRVHGPDGPLLGRVTVDDARARRSLPASGFALVHERAGVEITLSTPALRPRVVTLLGGELIVTLAPALWVRIDVAGWDAERDAALRLVLVDPDGRAAGEPLAVVDGSARRALERAGPWRVGFAKAGRPDVVHGAPTTIEVLDVDGFQRFELAVPDAWRDRHAQEDD